MIFHLLVMTSEKNEILKIKSIKLWVFALAISEARTVVVLYVLCIYSDYKPVLHIKENCNCQYNK